MLPTPYGRIAKLAAKGNPRLINIPPHNSKEWKIEYSARIFPGRCKKREKTNLKLEDGRRAPV